MISQALLVGNFEAAVDICVDSERMVQYCNSIAVLYIRSLGAAEGAKEHETYTVCPVPSQSKLIAI